MRIAAIGLAGGFFSSLFGVGGGIVMVPLLLLAGRWGERRAMATSLGAIGIVALAGVVGYAILGEVEVGPAVVVGIPAAIGVLAGTALQQRLANRTLSFAFAGLLFAIAVWMAI